MKPRLRPIVGSTALHAAKNACAFAVLAAASLPALAANMFCCSDERGKQACGDILPQACIGRVYREINERGMTVKVIEAPLTAEQRAQRAAEEKQRKEREAIEKEQARLDAALLQTYGSAEDIEVMRKRAQADTQASIAAAEQKIAEARKRRLRFENEAEFYKKKELPPEVRKGLKDADFEIQAQENLIEAKNKELDTIKAKYDEDRRRFLEVSRSRSRAQQAQSPVQPSQQNQSR